MGIALRRCADAPYMRWWKYRLTCLKLSTGNDDTLWRENRMGDAASAWASWGAASSAPTEYQRAWFAADGKTYRRGAEGAEKSQIKIARPASRGGRYKFKSEFQSEVKGTQLKLAAT